MRTIVFLLSVAVALNSAAAKVENFVLLDQTGDAHELYYYSDASAIVLTVQGNGCPIVRNVLPDLMRVRGEYESKGVVFLMINSNLQDNRRSIQEEAAEWDIDLTILIDDTQMIGRSLGLTRTAEVLVVDPQNWELKYRGPLNDRLDYERQKPEIKNHYVTEALDAMLSSSELTVDKRDTKGCIINFEHDDETGAQLSYVNDVVPILKNRCMSCHAEGGIGSWAMSNYTMIKGFSPMIREVLRTPRMPPWHADPHVGECRNDRSLSVAEKQTLISWIEAGSPRGDGEDPLAQIPPIENAWAGGQPDIVVDIPTFTVPAQGVVEYQYSKIPTDLEEGVWVRGIQVLPGNTKVVHHVLFGTVDSDENTRRGNAFDNFIGGYAPGGGVAEVPEDTGIWIPPNSQFLVQMHYTPYGKEEVDETKIGIYLYKEKPQNFLRHGVVVNLAIEIPAQEKAHEEYAYFEFDKDALLYHVLPHSHYRDRSSTFSLRYPDGTEDLILNVPNDDFNWQTGYKFTEPKFVSAGTKLIHTTVYDNSELNLGNPDPTKVVRWGLQSWDEMLFGNFTYRWLEETTENPIHDGTKVSLMQAMGFLDKDFDGVISTDELQKSSRIPVAKNPVFQSSDEDGDEKLNLDEFTKYRVTMRKLAEARRKKAREQAENQTQSEGA